MINLSNNIVIIVGAEQLSIAVDLAIQDTHHALISFYVPGTMDIRLEEITSTRDNNLKSLAFCKYIPKYKDSYDAEWVKKVFVAVHENTGESIKNGRKGIFDEVVRGENIPGILSRELWRGLRLFLLALWCRKAVLLPMTFSLPATAGQKEIAAFLYTEVLAIYRQPAIKESLGVADISACITSRAHRNFKTYNWRPIIASNWHRVEDINSEDLIELFKELNRRTRPENKDQKSPAYPLSPKSFIGPIIETVPERCRFDTKLVSIFNNRITRATETLQYEVESGNYRTAHREIKRIWVAYEKRYIAQLKEVKRHKTTAVTENMLGKLNLYLFSLIPQSGHTPPLPTEFGRRHMEGIGVPALREVLSRRDAVTCLERFFDYLESSSSTEKDLAGFINPIISLDKPRERQSRQTKKKTLRINDFRLFYEIIHAVEEFSWYVAKHIGEGTAPAKWADLLNDKNRYSVVDTEEFGFVPIVRCTQLDGTPIIVILRWIPLSVIPCNYIHLNHSPSHWSVIPNLSGIHISIMGVETGLRQIHIRWLDKRTFIASPVEPNSWGFELLVNTDKVTNEWVRPTAKTALVSLERQIESQSWVASNHFETELFYDSHELSDFGKICPIFMKYSEAKVFTSASVASFFRNFMYFFNQVKQSIGHKTTDAMPAEVSELKFDCRVDFDKATRCREKFKTKYTPHGLRATIVSVNAPIVPPHIIGKYMTGHTSENMVRYYTVMDGDYISELKAYNRQQIFGTENRVDNVLAIRADSRTSGLRKAIDAAPIDDVLREYGAFSLAGEDAKGVVQSGLSAIRFVNRGDIKIDTTHICPLNNQCPSEIVDTIGAKACGQCYYSVKTIDHLPRILAHCRALSRALDKAKSKLKYVSGQGATEEILEALEEDIIRLAGELGAWILTAEVLSRNFEQLRGRVLVNTPEILSEKLAECIEPDSELENLLIQCQEAAAYPELADSVLYADVGMVRARILAMSGSIDELLAPLDSYQLLDNFRGLIRGICIATGKSPKELAEHMEVHQSSSPALLNTLGRLHD